MRMGGEGSRRCRRRDLESKIRIREWRRSKEILMLSTVLLRRRANVVKTDMEQDDVQPHTPRSEEEMWQTAQDCSVCVCGREREGERVVMYNGYSRSLLLYSRSLLPLHVWSCTMVLRIRQTR
jgi:hypothetical protein